jgi:hypothetical protein
MRDARVADRGHNVHCACHDINDRCSQCTPALFVSKPGPGCCAWQLHQWRRAARVPAGSVGALALVGWGESYGVEPNHQALDPDKLACLCCCARQLRKQHYSAWVCLQRGLCLMHPCLLPLRWNRHPRATTPACFSPLPHLLPPANPSPRQVNGPNTRLACPVNNPSNLLNQTDRTFVARMNFQCTSPQTGQQVRSGGVCGRRRAASAPPNTHAWPCQWLSSLVARAVHTSVAIIMSLIMAVHGRDGQPGAADAAPPSRALSARWQRSEDVGERVGQQRAPSPLS